MMLMDLEVCMYVLYVWVVLKLVECECWYVDDYCVVVCDECCVGYE